MVLIETLAWYFLPTKTLTSHPVTPRLIRVLPRLLGYRIDGTEQDLRALARQSIVIAFEPISPLASSKE